jgi:hypothetical protein
MIPESAFPRVQRPKKKREIVGNGNWGSHFSSKVIDFFQYFLQATNDLHRIFSKKPEFLPFASRYFTQIL